MVAKSQIQYRNINFPMLGIKIMLHHCWDIFNTNIGAIIQYWVFLKVIDNNLSLAKPISEYYHPMLGFYKHLEYRVM